MGTNTPVAKTSMLIRRPVHDVYEAFVDPTVTTRFWFTRSTGRLDQHDHLRWEWDTYDVHSDVEVVEIVPDRRIVITWSGYQARERVEWAFTDRRDGTTYLTIEHSGFAGEPDELVEQVVSGTEGFAYTLAGAKAWLEHGIQLNLVPDKHPDHHEPPTQARVWEHNRAPRTS
jgi:uncharacterized protein YndB with AHSA1/START domain